MLQLFEMSQYFIYIISLSLVLTLFLEQLINVSQLNLYKKAMVEQLNNNM